MIEVKEVKTKKQIKEFIEFPLELYKGNPCFVPPLYGDEMKMFKPNYVYYDQAEAVCFNAYMNEKIVGRIQAILQKVANEKWGQKRVRFTRFDCINDQRVANMLFDAAAEWAKSKGMEEIVGPLGFSDLEREGMLIEGFDELSTFEEQYNYAYYPTLVENYGFIKDVDWVERKIYAPKEHNDRLKRLSEMVLKKYKLHFGEAKNTNDFLRKYADAFFEILDKTYENIYGTVPFTDGMKKMMISNFKLIIDIKYVAVILDENDNVVCFGLCFPSIAKAVQKSGGRLTPGAIIRLLRAIKKPDIIDLGLVGVLPEYAMKGVSAAIFAGLMDMLVTNKNIKYAETNLNLEDNANIINQWKNFDAVLHKRRRSYIKKI
ncbi:MAG: hypothetical protein J6X00_03400 [Clostridia bacterium]|nr:hypothetical protein [Clostridia bacterium]